MGSNQKSKVVHSKTSTHQKSVSGDKYSSDNKKIIWFFDWLDNDGTFAFNLSRSDFNHKEVLEKIISYSNMTWADVKKQTHDDGRSKHHLLSIDSLSSEAEERIKAKRLDEYTDSVFSFALQNKLRIIGIRINEVFHAVWYDPHHRFCPSRKK